MHFFSDGLFDASADLFDESADRPNQPELHEQSEDVSMEESLEEPAILEQPETQCPAQFKLVEDSTKRGRVKLVDSRGYTFNVKRRRVTATDWQCTSRPASNPCRATVVQRGDTFQPSLRSYNHPAQVGAALAAIVSAKVKAKAVRDLFKPAPVIVDEVSIGFEYFYIILIEERKK